jgi:hypothetical protein
MSEVTDVVDAQVDAYFVGDLEGFLACYASDVVIVNAPGEVLTEGHDVLSPMYGGFLENQPAARRADSQWHHRRQPRGPSRGDRRLQWTG